MQEIRIVLSFLYIVQHFAFNYTKWLLKLQIDNYVIEFHAILYESIIETYREALLKWQETSYTTG